ncbi:hypothetical protein QQ73_17050 [Candidatus Endoriftia persephone str. Guaymas]|nr:hypothetical protein [Candidatus Endoriftia persephone str. Guaymas]
MRQFERTWAKERTYGRWEEWGTWYGFSYHSGAALMKAPDRPPNTVEHFSRQYFDIALLLFYLRVTLFRFSAKLGSISEQGLTDDNFRAIREQFAHFTIRYQFPILSNQQQGIELYEKARKYFDLEDLYKEVKAEIHETHEYLEMDGSKDLNRAAVRLSQWGIPLAAGALVAGLFGMNISDFRFAEYIVCLFSDAETCNSVNWEAVFLFFVVFIFWGVTAWLLHKRGKDSDQEKG